MYDILIIGAGVVGSMIARTLSKYNLKVLVLEKDNDVGNETSSANSAIVHSGYDPIPSTNKAKFNVLGNEMFDVLADELDVPFKRIGSITVAFDGEQMNTLRDLAKRAETNGVTVKLLDKDEVHRAEPLLSEEIVGGLLAPTAGIVDPFNLTVHAMENAIDNGVELLLNTKVESIEKADGYFTVNGKYKSRLVINCAGVYSDEINRLVNKDGGEFSVMPRKGEYLVLDHFTRPFVSHTIFMVPSEKGKGVLISPTTSGNYLIGPSAELTSKDDTATDKPTVTDIKRQASAVIPNIPFYETIRTFAGVRATPSTHDFIIGESGTKGFINVGGIESPGLVSSPAIAEYVVGEIVGRLITLTKKEDYNPRVRRYIRTAYMSEDEKQKLFEKNSDFGKIICKCEKISKGEILDCLSRSCPPHSVKGLKRRLRVGFGRCQGGMCQSDALNLLAEYYHVEKDKIPYDGQDSYILACKTKEVK